MADEAVRKIKSRSSSAEYKKISVCSIVFSVSCKHNADLMYYCNPVVKVEKFSYRNDPVFVNTLAKFQP